jgi:cell division transport system ATP-binding protein
MTTDSTGPTIVARFERVRLQSTERWTDPVDLELRSGDFYILAGDDERAKRSLIDMLTLRDRPSGGTLQIFGQKVSRPRPRIVAALRRRMGIVQDSVPLLPHLNVFDNVALPLRIVGIDERNVGGLVDEMLGVAALRACADLRLGELSLQETCGVAMARAMITRPEILLIEGIFERLSPDWAWRLLQLAEGLRRQGAAVIAVASDERLMTTVPGARTIRVNRPAEKVPFYRSIW